MGAVIVGVLSLLSGALALTSQPEHPCTIEEFQQCMQSLQSVAQSNDLAFAATREDLLVLCSNLKDGVLCVDDHMARCFTKTQQRVFNHVVAGARQVLADMCVPGPVQEEYLRHSACFKNISLAEDKCAPTYRHVVQLSENVDAEKDVDEGLRKFCCAFSEFVQCKYFHVAKDCGIRAGAFLQRHLETISDPLIHQHCASYTYDSEQCTSGSTTGLLSTWLWLVAVAFSLASA